MKRLTLIFALFFTIALSYAQKPALDHSVYDTWNTLRALSLPHNGDIMMYTITPGEGDVILVIENIRTRKKIEVPRATRAKMSEDGKTVIAVIKPLFSQTRDARIKKAKREDMPKDTLAVIDILSGNIEKIANYKSYNTPDKFTGIFAFEMNPAKEKPAKKEKAAADTSKATGTAKAEKPAKPAKELYLRNIATGKTDTIKNVAMYKFNKEGSLIAYTLEADKKDSTSKAALMLYNVATGESTKVIDGPKGSKIKLPEFSKVNTLAFYANTDTAKAAKQEIGIYHYNIASKSLEKVADNKMEGLQKGWIVSENASLSISEDGKRLFFGTAPKPREKDTTLVEFEQPQLDIWSWHDDYLQPVQLLKKSQDLKRTYTAYVNLENGKFVQLGDLDVPNVVVYNKQMADLVLVGNNNPYRIESQWDGNRYTDIYLVNVNDGSRKLIKEKACYGFMSVSPNGEWAVVYDKPSKDWYLYTVSTGEMKNLTGSLGVTFHDEDHDRPDFAGPSGQAIWFEDNSAFVIGDRYDYWKFDPEGVAAPENFTDSYGRNNNVRLSMVSLIEDPERPHAVGRPAAVIKPGEKLFFTTYNYKTREGGLATKDLSKKKSALAKLVEGPYVFANFAYSKAGKSKKEAFIYARGNFEEGNNAFVTYDNFKTQKQISDINPQQREYNWGTVELVNWQTADNICCEGLLYKPENLDPAKKYPVMIYFYEKESEKLYNPRFPTPSRSTINIPYFVSNGYVVFVPDIYYTEGHPGQSAMRSIMPGVEMLEKTYPWIDGENMAIQGQSWGGYQVAYMITQTDKFKAAGAGAPVANMTSAYGGIRWGSGITRQIQYKHGQSRIGKDLWSGYDLYYENSPLFFVPNVKTPVLIMHNDRDGAVPWYQGIEFFTALRRCGKIAWMLQYNNEEHNLEERRNAKDLSIRLSQFFDHYLKGAPMPKWMKHGRPATEKGIDLGYELTED